MLCREGVEERGGRERGGGGGVGGGKGERDRGGGGGEREKEEAEGLDGKKLHSVHVNEEE